MGQSYGWILTLHLYSLYLFGFLMFVYLCLTQGKFKTEFQFIKRIRLFLPIFYMFLAIVFFTGILLLAMKNFKFDLFVSSMIVIWMIIFFLSIVQFKFFKKARKERKYKKFASISALISLLDFILFFTPFVMEI